DDEAVFPVRTFLGGCARSAAVGIRLGAVLDDVAARRGLARDVADAARAIARRAACLPGAATSASGRRRGSAAVDVALALVFGSVRARRRGAVQGGAERARAVRPGRTRLRG